MTNSALQRVPLDVATDCTVSFIATTVPVGAAILEVGCGAGEVASELASRGYDVTGLDADETAVAAARAHGVAVLHAEWPDVETGTFDAVVFTRSLHHISPLGDAIDKAARVLRENGVLLVEDFDCAHGDARSLDWIRTAIQSSGMQELLTESDDGLIARLLRGEDALAAWRAAHDHELHPAAAMEAAINELFPGCVVSHVPYLYRNLVPLLPASRDAAALVREIYDSEWIHGEAGDFDFVGRRYVARRPA